MQDQPGEGLQVPLGSRRETCLLRYEGERGVIAVGQAGAEGGGGSLQQQVRREEEVGEVQRLF